MKKLILLTAILASATQAFAQDSSKDLLANKSQIIAFLTKEKAIIDSEISCLNAAATKENMNNCHEQKKSQMSALKEERKALRQERVENRREKLNEKINEKSAEKSE